MIFISAVGGSCLWGSSSIQGCHDLSPSFPVAVSKGIVWALPRRCGTDGAGPLITFCWHRELVLLYLYSDHGPLLLLLHVMLTAASQLWSHLGCRLPRTSWGRREGGCCTGSRLCRRLCSTQGPGRCLLWDGLPPPYPESSVGILGHCILTLVSASKTTGNLFFIFLMALFQKNGSANRVERVDPQLCCYRQKLSSAFSLVSYFF